MKRGWTDIPFLELVEDTTRLATKIPQAAYETTGRYPIYDQGAGDVAGYTNDETTTYRGRVPAVLFGDHTRVVKYASEPFVLGADGVKALTPRPGVDPRFAYHAIRYIDVPAAGYSRHFKFLKEARFPLPPLDEQRRIAAVLDHVDSLRAARRRALHVLAEAPLSLLSHLFGAPHSWPSRWPMGKIDDLVASVQYGSSAKAGESGQWPILRMGNITDDGRIDLTDLKYIDLTETEIPKYTTQRGDLLFNRTNSKEKVGKSAVVHTDDALAIAGYLIRVRLTADHRAEFVSAYLNSNHGRAVRRRLAKAAVNQANINAQELRSIPIALPPKGLQDQFANALASVAQRRSALEESLTGLDTLFVSLQARAFAGELDVEGVRIPPA